ncbi:GNAT family N-acetyltransferase [Jiella sp. MQZ9-1]|uniref:GNAT family N-acetyltransferase n=1 Tax=Jiella flava TaxID=2816857 RepID=A0A939JUJ5_9HYPH|nr:GNAT family N-acetyltransferase [Jiella flava]MBO0663245.1 GNAT family N-acetyltransferase [Jiella flava]MCD2471821.1 GNAT family N-acetyltransferase [Jiella flava]
MTDEETTERPRARERVTRAIVTPRLRLRPLALGDAPTVAKLLDDYDIVKMLSRLPWPYSLDDAESFIADHGEETVFAICVKASGGLVGLCGLQPDETRMDRGELGFWIGRPHWGNGYATEAAHAAIDYGFTALRLNEITVNCRVINDASRRVIWKCGFRFRGNGMIDTVAAGRVAAEHFVLDRSCWRSLKSWGEA